MAPAPPPYNQYLLPEPPLPPMCLLTMEPSDWVHGGPAIEKPKPKIDKKGTNKGRVHKKKSTLKEPPPNMINPFFCCFHPFMTPRCPGCGLCTLTMQSLLSHMLGQGAGRNDNERGIKMACTNFLHDHAYFVNIERSANKLSASEREDVCHQSPFDPVTKKLTEDILDQMAFANFEARATILSCNELNPVCMKYNTRPKPDVPSHILKACVFESNADASQWATGVPKHNIPLLEEFRTKWFHGGPAGKAEVIAEMKSRIEFEARVGRQAAKNGFDMNSSYKLLFDPVPADYLDQFTTKRPAVETRATASKKKRAKSTSAAAAKNPADTDDYGHLE